MAKLVRLMVAVAAEKLADVIESITADGGTVALAGTSGAADDEMDAGEVPAALVRGSKRRITRLAQAAEVPAPSPANGVRRSINPRPGGRVIYTPVGTQKQITAMLAGLQSGTMTAAVLTDIAKHPGTSNADVRKRLAPWAKKNGLSVESVDNVIWSQVNKGRIAKDAAE